MRILMVDDEPAMLDSYRRCFAPADTGADALHDMAVEMFGDVAPVAPSGEGETIQFDAVYSTPGLDAVAEIEAAIAQGAPFAVAFIDDAHAAGDRPLNR